jgi:hypothetical protein
MKLSGAESNN